jgi:hypothetical protein
MIRKWKRPTIWPNSNSETGGDRAKDLLREQNRAGGAHLRNAGQPWLATYSHRGLASPAWLPEPRSFHIRAKHIQPRSRLLCDT